MGIIYSPLLLLIASVEACRARRVRRNRRRGEDDDGEVHEWEAIAAEVDFDADTDEIAAGGSWRHAVEESRPNVHVDKCTLEVMQLKEQVKELTEMVRALVEEKQSQQAGEMQTNGQTNGQIVGEQEQEQEQVNGDGAE